MKILYLSYYFRPDITAAAFRSSDFVDFLTQENIENRIITTYPHKSDEVIGEEESFLHPIKRVRLKRMKGKGFMSYILHYMSFVPKAFYAALQWRWKGWKPTVIYISSPPIFIGLVGVMLKWTFRCHMVLEIRDIWPDSAVAAGQLRSEGWAYKIARIFEKWLYRKSDGLVCVGNYMKEYLQDYTDKHICVAYNGPKEATVNAVTELKVSPKKEEKVLKLAYAGNFGLVQGLEHLIEAFSKMSSVKFRWELHFFGAGVMEEALKNQVVELKIEHQVHFHGAFPKNELNKLLVDMDVLFLGLIKADALEKTIPSKLFDYLSFGKPIIAALIGEGKEILQQNKANIVVDDCTAEFILKGIESVDNHFDEMSLAANNNISLLKNGFTREVNNQKIKRYLLKTLNVKL